MDVAQVKAITFEPADLVSRAHFPEADQAITARGQTLAVSREGQACFPSADGRPLAQFLPRIPVPQVDAFVVRPGQQPIIGREGKDISREATCFLAGGHVPEKDRLSLAAG